MCAAGLVAALLAVNAERRSLEDIATPLSSAATPAEPAAWVDDSVSRGAPAPSGRTDDHPSGGASTPDSASTLDSGAGYGAAEPRTANGHAGQHGRGVGASSATRGTSHRPPPTEDKR